MSNGENDKDRKKYNSMEPLLQKLNQEFISMSKDDVKRNNEILPLIINTTIEKMTQQDALFKEMYSQIFYGGSFYDGLKVAHPDEYDLDLLLTLPSQLKYKVTSASNVPGFVHVKFQDYTPSIQKLDLQGKHKGMDKLINANHYLDVAKVLGWIQSVLQRALNTLDKDANGRYIFKTPYGNFHAKLSKAGAAYTLKATGIVGNKQVNLDIDLVLCFVFSKEQWPTDAFRKNPVNGKPNFFIVPKQVKGVNNSDLYWRLSFQEQERVIMDNKATLKPTVKLLKKMRDHLQHDVIASYYLKTVALWAIEENDPNFFNKNSLSYAFMTVLKKYQKYLEQGNIPYYWNKGNNLLKNINRVTIENINNKIKAMIADIERNLENPILIGKYLVSPEEVLRVSKQYGIH